MLRPSSLVRESMTRESGCRQNGQCMAETDYASGASRTPRTGRRPLRRGPGAARPRRARRSRRDVGQRRAVVLDDLLRAQERRCRQSRAVARLASGRAARDCCRRDSRPGSPANPDRRTPPPRARTRRGAGRRGGARGAPGVGVAEGGRCGPGDPRGQWPTPGSGQRSGDALGVAGRAPRADAISAATAAASDSESVTSTADACSSCSAWLIRSTAIEPRRRRRRRRR